MSDAQPHTLGRYQIEYELGRGAMGVVYKAHDPLLERAVAIKTILLSGDDAERTNYEARFLQEAKAAGRLSHPAIITIHDVGREGDLLYMAMEMLHGIDLRTRIARSVPPLRDTLALALQIADGLAFAHEQGVVHRDIKPGNIMIVRGDHAKIMDFGIARLQYSDIKTQTGVLLGTPRYMSPEQVGGGVIDHRSDVFSLGSVLYETLTGRPAFAGADTAQLMYNIATAPHMPPSRLNRNIPPLVDLIVARALEKDRGARYQDAGQLAADLRACLAGLPAEEVGAETTANGRPERPELERSAHYRSDTATELLTRPAAGPQSSAGAETQLPPATHYAPTQTTDAARVYALSQRFNSTEALKQLSDPDWAAKHRLSQIPKRSRGLRRLLHDRDRMLAAGIIAVSALVACAIALIQPR